MARYDLVIKNGCIVDGTGTPRIFGDLAIQNGIIERVGGEISTTGAGQIIEAEGRIVAPGVIDPHTHYDAQVHWDPYCTNSSWHGNTTVVVGNCGFGFSPCKPDARERYMALMENTEQVPIGAMRSALSWDWETFPQWIDHMKRLPKGINMASFLPLNSLMLYVMGYEAAKTRGANKAERQQMRDLLNEAMDAGAIGFALSHLNEFNTHKDCDGTPMPTDGMQIDDAYYLAEVLRERGEGVVQCLCELPGGVANRAVVEEIARLSRRPVIHNVIAAFDAMPDYHRDILRWLEKTEREGLNIYSQALAFRAWTEFNAVDYNAWDNIPLFNTFSLAGDADAKAKLAADPEFLARARAEYNPAQMLAAGGTLESFALHNANGASDFAKFNGMMVGEIAEKTGKGPTDVFFGIIAQSAGRADFRTTDAISHDATMIGELLGHKRVIAGTSDGGAHVKFFSGGQFATDNILSMVRENDELSLEEMHFKLSNLPARVLGLHQRGVLLEGYAADLYIYDYEGLGFEQGRYEVVHDLPDGDWRRVSRAQGIDWVVVNGEPIFQGQECTKALPGRIVSNRGPEVDASLRRVA